ncbi:MAG: pyridoxamine 5'-phosphate oxidase family protein [Bacteroidales bacterium]
MKAFHYTNKEEMYQIIDACTLCQVAINNPDEAPYLFPMNFVRLGDEIYLHSAPEGTHLSLLAKDNRISLSFNRGEELVNQHEKVACSYSMRSDSVVVVGDVDFINCMDQKRLILNELMHKFIPEKAFIYSEPALRNVKIWKIRINKMTGKGVGLTYEQFKELEKKKNNSY